MRKLLLLAVAFLLLAAPAWADTDDIDIEVTIGSCLYFNVDPAGPLTLSITSVWASSTWHNLSADLTVDVDCNEDWDLSCQVMDGGGEDNDWGNTWDVRINGASGWVFDEADGVTDLYGGALTEGPAGTNDYSWDVEVQIPWPTAPDTYDCNLAFTCTVD